MSAEILPELVYDDYVAQPDIYLVPPLNEVDEVQEDGADVRYDAFSRGKELVKDKIVTIEVEVDGESRPLRVNASRGTLANGQSIESFFERYEYATYSWEKNGVLNGDFDLTQRMADHAIRVARAEAGFVAPAR